LFYIRTCEEPLKNDDDFELNKVVEDVIHGSPNNAYSLGLEKEKIVLNLLPCNQVYKIQTGKGSEDKNCCLSETQG